MQRPIARPSFLQPSVQEPRVMANLLRQYVDQIQNLVNSIAQTVGANIASAATIKPTNAIHHVTGTTDVDTIVAPVGFSGPIWLIADDGFAFTSADNIAGAGTVTLGFCRVFVYDPNTELWYPGE